MFVLLIILVNIFMINILNRIMLSNIISKLIDFAKSIFYTVTKLMLNKKGENVMFYSLIILFGITILSLLFIIKGLKLGYIQRTALVVPGVVGIVAFLFLFFL